MRAAVCANFGGGFSLLGAYVACVSLSWASLPFMSLSLSPSIHLVSIYLFLRLSPIRGTIDSARPEITQFEARMH